jgi:hypothetical protein
MSNVIIKTAESEVKFDKNGRKYKTVSFGEVKYIDTPFGKMLVPATQARTTKTNCYELNYLNKQDSGYADALFNSANPTNGGWFMGSIETREVKPYDITAADGTTRTVNTYTTVVFSDTDSPAHESAVKAAFASKGHEVMTGDVSVNKTVSALEALRAEIGG